MKKLNGASVMIMLTALMLPRIFEIYTSANRVNLLWLKIFISHKLLTALQSAVFDG